MKLTSEKTSLEYPKKHKCFPSLSNFQWTQLFLLSTSYSMAFASVTLIFSKAPLIVQSTGGSVSIGPISIALFEFGKSIVVLPVGQAIRRLGRKMVFLFGGCFGLLSSVFGILGVIFAFPHLIFLSTFFTGTSTGIAYGYRFAAIEIAKPTSSVSFWSVSFSKES